MKAMTEKHLKEAFAGESQAHMKYLAFAAKAEKDGLPHVARLFRAVASAEIKHAHYHLRELEGLGPRARVLDFEDRANVFFMVDASGNRWFIPHEAYRWVEITPMEAL